MTRYRPVPRTLSDIMRRLAPAPESMPSLMSPEQLSIQRAPMPDPQALFKGVVIRAAQPALSEMRTPAHLFGDQQLALPGQELASPQELDLLPSNAQMMPVMLLPDLPPPAELEMSEPSEHIQVSKFISSAHDDEGPLVL